MPDSPSRRRKRDIPCFFRSLTVLGVKIMPTCDLAANSLPTSLGIASHLRSPFGRPGIVHESAALMLSCMHTCMPVHNASGLDDSEG
jgi:hypothetical protein